jgi:hypothetical protein
MGQRALKNVNNCWNTNIYSYLETSGGQISILYLYVLHFLTSVLIRHLWQLKTVVFLHWSLLCAVLLITKYFFTSAQFLRNQTIFLLKNFMAYTEVSIKLPTNFLFCDQGFESSHYSGPATRHTT